MPRLPELPATAATCDPDSPDEGALDVLVVGAGPTGLALAAGLARFGVGFRIIDRVMDRTHESRALGVQARSLEVLQSLGLGEALVARGNPSARLRLHLDRARTAELRLTDGGATDTRFPFILFVSQAETEAVLGDHLGSAGVTVERGAELVDIAPGPAAVRCRIRHRDGREEQVWARYLAGCDGAHSTARHLTGIPFEGDAYLQDFMLGDVEVDGPLERDTLHSFAVGAGVAMFFPLRSPATWRVIAMPGGGAGRSPAAGRGRARETRSLHRAGAVERRRRQRAQVRRGGPDDCGAVILPHGEVVAPALDAASAAPGPRADGGADHWRRGGPRRRAGRPLRAAQLGNGG